MKPIIKYFPTILFVFTAFTCTSAWANHPAEVLVKDTITSTLARLEKDDELIKKNPNHIYDLIEELILPKFDFEQIAS